MSTQTKPREWVTIKHIPEHPLTNGTYSKAVAFANEAQPAIPIEKFDPEIGTEIIYYDDGMAYDNILSYYGMNPWRAYNQCVLFKDATEQMNDSLRGVRKSKHK